MHGFSALFGAIIGFLAAIAPELIQMLKDRFSHQRDLEARQQELDAAAKGYEYTIHNQDEQLEAQAAEIVALQLQAADNDDVKGHIVLQFLRSSVRPIVTYGFFALFATIKLAALHHGIDYGTPVDKLLEVIWDDDTESLFAAVVTFWFGSRLSPASANKKASSAASPTTVLRGTNRITGE
jgi:hypothetical protein